MCPLNIIEGGRIIYTIPAAGGGHADDEMDVQYNGDSLGTGYVQMKRTGATVSYNLQFPGEKTGVISIPIREVPPIERGANPTTIFKRIILERT